MRSLLTLGLLLAASTAWADPPKPVKATTPAKVGETVQVTVNYKAPFVWVPGFDTDHCIVARLQDGQDGVASFWVQPKVAGEFHVILFTVGEKRADRFVVKTSGTPAPPVVVDPVVPPPVPKPPVDPVTPPPAPADTFPAGEKLWGVVLIEETERAAVARGKITAHKPLFDYFTANNIKRTIVDQDVKDQTGATPPKLVPYINDARKVGVPRLYVVGTKGTTFGMKPPAAPEAMLELLQKYNK